MKFLSTEDFYNTVRKSHIIIDSSIWIPAFKNEEEFQEIFLSLTLAECEPLTLPPIEFEVLRRIKKHDDYETVVSFIQKYTSEINDSFKKTLDQK